LAACGAPPSAAATLEQQLLADAADGRLDDLDFLSACLIAGGVSNPGELALLRQEFDVLRQEIDTPALRELPLEERCGALQARLHAAILTGHYRAGASDLRVAIRRGDYNCLSVAAIYYSLSRQAEIELQIWSRPGHVYLVCPETGARIEPASHVSSGDASGAPAVEGPARPITPLQLLGRFYYNRGVTLLQANQFPEGLALLRISLRLDPQDREAQGNLLAGLNNWAVALCRQERFPEARLLIGQGLAIDPGYEPLVTNARYVRAHRSP
jgi:tetratricopeptide (TPR) repeat protein